MKAYRLIFHGTMCDHNFGLYPTKEDAEKDARDMSLPDYTIRLEFI